MAAKCPKCENLIYRVNAHHVDVYSGTGKKWHGVTYACPHCSTSLGAEIDPIALKADTVAAVVKELKKRG